MGSLARAQKAAYTNSLVGDWFFKPRLHQGNMLLVAVNKIVASLLPVCMLLDTNG